MQPSSIPFARAAFSVAAGEVDDLVRELSGLITPAWATDPVSEETAKQFDSGSAGASDMGQRAAIEQLKAYQKQLTSSSEALHAAHISYVGVEAANRSKAGDANRFDD